MKGDHRFPDIAGQRDLTSFLLSNQSIGRSALHLTEANPVQKLPDLLVNDNFKRMNRNQTVSVIGDTTRYMQERRMVVKSQRYVEEDEDNTTRLDLGELLSFDVCPGKQLSFGVSPNGTSRPTVLDQHKFWSTFFEERGIPEPDLSSKYIIEHVLKIKKSYEFELNMKRKVTEEEESQIRKLCECRLARMPVQYIIKEWDFRELRLAMAPPVFIPRPETEQLVSLVLKKASSASVLLEIGCGSGAICLSLVKALPQAQVIAIDQSNLACQLTRRNAKMNDLMTDNLQVVHSELKADGSLSQPLHLDRPVDVIVSNPPYVSHKQMLDLQPEIKLYEDMRALEAGEDGLKVVRPLLTFASSTLRRGGLVFLEVDSSHPCLIQQWINTHPELKIKFVKTYKDLSDRDRFVKLKKL